MFFSVFIFVTGIVQIMGRPSLEDNQLDGNYIRISRWPLEENVFLLPTSLNTNDIINVTIATEGATEINLHFMGADNEEDQELIIFALSADMRSNTVTVVNDAGEEVVNQPIEHFFLDEKKMLFNFWLKRRMHHENEHNDILQVNTISYSPEPFINLNINKMRYLKLNGDNVKLMNLDFKFAQLNK